MMRSIKLKPYLLAATPFIGILILWSLLPSLLSVPAYKLPSPQLVWSKAIELTVDGSLAQHILVSLYRLALGFVLGNLLAVPIGIAIGINRHASDFMLPLLTFLQSIAGIAWIPLAVLWFGIGDGAIVFVIANIIFFSNLYNTVIGVESIPQTFYRAVLSLGASRFDILKTVIIPGAFVQLIVGFRSSMAFGWRALIGAELIAGTTGLGYMTLDAVQWYQTETVILGMIIVGIIWLVMDRFLFRRLETMTVRRWGILNDK